MLYAKKSIIIALLICTTVQAIDVATVGQDKFLSLCHKAEKELDRNGTLTMDFIIDNVKVLLEQSLDKSISDGQVLNNHLDNLYVPSFDSFLTPTIGKHKNPFFNYALSYFFNSERFKKGDLQFKQKSCFKLIVMLESCKYTEFHQFILKMLFTHFHNEEYYSQDSKRWIQNIILSNRDKTFKGILLLIFFNHDNIDTKTIHFLQKKIDFCKEFNRKDIIPWLSLAFVAKTEEGKYVNLLCAITKQIDNTQNRIRNATYIFPYLTLVQKTEIVELLKEYLKDSTIIDQGDDIMHRYTGLSYLAAMSLYTMIDGFPEFSQYKFDQIERQKCLDWINNNPNYKFRKIDYWSDDPVISRMRFLIFEYN